MIDSHAHIDTKAFDSDREEMIARAWDAGVEYIIIPDIEPSRREHLKNVAASDERIFRGVGIHPHHVGEITSSDIDDIRKQCHEDDVVAIGEIGLDYHYDFCPPDIQKSYFREQVQIAKQNDLPIIVHNRESDEDILSILKDEQDGSLRGVLHCFSSDLSVMERVMDLGLHISFTGNITFKRSTMDDVVRQVPNDRFMIETDSPYITPVPHRGKRNEPAYVGLVAQKIAEIKNMTLEDIFSMTTKTARTLFKLGIVFIALTATALAQPEYPRDEDYETDYEWDIAVEDYYADSVAYEKWIKPRKLGVGLSYGTNTVVERQAYTQWYKPENSPDPTSPARWEYFASGTGPERSFSFDGLSSFGGTITYGLLTSLIVEGSYFFTQNTKPAEDFGLDPITTHIFELAAVYNFNPYKKVNFLPQVGFTMALSDDASTSRTKFGLNAGMGLGINIPTSIGLFYPVFNVRFNFMFGTDEGRIVRKYLDEDTGEVWVNSADPSVTSIDIADVTTIYSIPRLTILYYIPMD